MPEHEPWLTALFNDHLAGVANVVLSLAGLKPGGRPWSGLLSMEILVALIIVVLFAILRSRLSMDRPGKLQHALEVIYNFLHAESEEHVGHDGPKYLSLFGPLFIFILFANLLGAIPSFESSTMQPQVCAKCFYFINTPCHRNLHSSYYANSISEQPVVTSELV